MGTFSIFSMQETQQDTKAPRTLLKTCLGIIKTHKESLKLNIDIFTSRTIASVICACYDKKELSDYDYLNLAELCITDDAISTDVIKSIQESTQGRSVRGKIQLFEKMPILSTKTQGKIMRNDPQTGTSVT